MHCRVQSLAQVYTNAHILDADGALFFHFYRRYSPLGKTTLPGGKWMAPAVCLGRFFLFSMMPLRN
jgi:hypothetical protein